MDHCFRQLLSNLSGSGLIHQIHLRPILRPISPSVSSLRHNLYCRGLESGRPWGAIKVFCVSSELLEKIFGETFIRTLWQDFTISFIWNETFQTSRKKQNI